MHLGTFSKPIPNIYRGQKLIYVSTYKHSASKIQFLREVLILEYFTKDFLKMFVNAIVLILKNMFCRCCWSPPFLPGVPLGGSGWEGIESMAQTPGTDENAAVNSFINSQRAPFIPSTCIPLVLKQPFQVTVSDWLTLSESPISRLSSKFQFGPHWKLP